MTGNVSKGRGHSWGRREARVYRSAHAEVAGRNEYSTLKNRAEPINEGYFGRGATMLPSVSSSTVSMSIRGSTSCGSKLGPSSAAK